MALVEVAVGQGGIQLNRDYWDLVVDKYTKPATCRDLTCSDIPSQIPSSSEEEKHAASW